MLLGDFLKELKHNSSWIEIRKNTCNEEYDDPDDILLEGTLGVIKNNIYYQEEYQNYSIGFMKVRYDEKMKCEFIIYIYKMEG